MRNGLNVDYNSKCRASNPFEQEKQKAIEIFRELRSENQEITYENFTSLWFWKFHSDFFIGQSQVAVLCPRGNISDKKLQTHMSKSFKKYLEQYGQLSINELNLELHQDPHISTITNPIEIKEQMDALYLRIICKSDPTKGTAQYFLQRWRKNKEDIIIGTSNNLEDIYLIAEKYFEQHYNEKLKQRTNQIKSLERKIARQSAQENTKNNAKNIPKSIAKHKASAEKEKQAFIRKLETATINADYEEQILIDAINKFKMQCDCKKYIYIFSNVIAQKITADSRFFNHLYSVEKVIYGNNQYFRIWIFEKNEDIQQVLQSLALFKVKVKPRNAIFQHFTFEVNCSGVPLESSCNHLCIVTDIDEKEFVPICDYDKAYIMCSDVCSFNSLYHITYDEQGEKTWWFINCKHIDKVLDKMDDEKIINN